MSSTASSGTRRSGRGLPPRRQHAQREGSQSDQRQSRRRGNRVASYFNLRKNLNQWQSWLAAHGPILAGLNVDQTWDNATSTKGNLDTPLPKTARGGHAIAVVGYTATGRFIIRNSWGPAWGDNGFAYASPAYITGAYFDESYGVTI
jgi:hypothetical protein